jgi:hypothetical protein
VPADRGDVAATLELRDWIVPVMKKNVRFRAAATHDFAEAQRFANTSKAMKTSLLSYRHRSIPSPKLHSCTARLIIKAMAALACSVAFGLSATPARAQAAALDFLSLGQGFDYTQGSYSLGWRFTARREIKVTELGFYDDNMDGLTENHLVGIYDVATKQLLISTTVSSADPLTGFFRYHAVNATTLPGGRDYYVVAVTGTEHYAVGVTELVVDAAINFIGFANNYGNSSTTELLYPDTEQADYHGDFGPSFKIANANPQSAAVDMPTLTGTDVNQAPFSMGYLFRPKQDLKVATLGYYDDKGDGFKQSHQVVIFDAVQKQAIVNTVVSSGDPLRGFFRYHPVPPVTLITGHDYFVIGDNSNDNYRRDVTSLSVSSLITLRGSAFNNQPPTLGPAFPTESHPGEAPFFGPTFEIGGPSQPLNISTRGNVRSGAAVMIGGFIITGSDPKKVLIRGIGPSLPLAGKLADPTLELFQGSTSLAFNDNWKDTQQSEIEASTIPPTNDNESAIVATLNPGLYTAIIRGNNATSGSGLVEVYDLSSTSISKLANISTRGFVGTSTARPKTLSIAAEGDDAPMIGGFIVGSASKYVVRAIGPSLGGPDVTDALQDPTLELFDGNGAQVAYNDNWQDSQAPEIEATGIPPTDARESAIVADLQGGPYTAVVRGKDSTSGVGLVEVYNIE